MIRILAIPLSWLYSLGVGLRHLLFNLGIKRSEEFDIPIVCVGNIAVGGTGKTPHTEYLVQLLAQRYRVAVLSRGYKRKTKGFYLSTDKSSYKKIGDEPRQIKLKFPNIPVAVCEKRAEGIRRLRAAHPEVNLIILDDAFQHRYVEPWVNIVLMEYGSPIYEDHMLPWGRLRDLPSQLRRAHIVLVTKCPKDIRPLDCRLVQKKLELLPYQSLFFTTFRSQMPQPLFPSMNPPSVYMGQSAVVMTGIANPRSFIDRLSRKFRVEDALIFPDHHTFTMRDIVALGEVLKSLPPNTLVVTTEKDAVKLMNSRKIPADICRRLHYVPISVTFLNDRQGEFANIIDQYVRENQKYKITTPR